MAGMKEELTTGLLLMAKLAAELAKGLEARGGSCEGRALEPEKGLEGRKGTADEPLKEFLWLLAKGSGGVLSKSFCMCMDSYSLWE